MVWDFSPIKTALKMSGPCATIPNPPPLTIESQRNLPNAINSVNPLSTPSTMSAPSTPLTPAVKTTPSFGLQYNPALPQMVHLFVCGKTYMVNTITMTVELVSDPSARDPLKDIPSPLLNTPSSSPSKSNNGSGSESDSSEDSIDLVVQKQMDDHEKMVQRMADTESSDDDDLDHSVFAKRAPPVRPKRSPPKAVTFRDVAKETDAAQKRRLDKVSIANKARGKPVIAYKLNANCKAMSYPDLAETTTTVRTIVGAYPTGREAADALNIDKAEISRICSKKNGRQSTTKDNEEYTFEFCTRDEMIAAQKVVTQASLVPKVKREKFEQETMDDAKEPAPSPESDKSDKSDKSAKTSSSQESFRPSKKLKEMADAGEVTPRALSTREASPTVKYSPEVPDVAAKQKKELEKPTHFPPHLPHDLHYITCRGHPNEKRGQHCVKLNCGHLHCMMCFMDSCIKNPSADGQQRCTICREPYTRMEPYSG